MSGNEKPYFSAKVTGLAVMAAVLFATQHPLTKSIIASTQAPFVIAALSAVIAFLSIPLLFVFGRSAREFSRLLLKQDNWIKLAIVTLIGFGSICIYALGLSRENAILVSLMLNTSVLWSALWARTLSGVKLPRAFWPCVILALTGIALPTFVQKGTRAFESTLTIGSFFILMVPALYMLRQQLIYRWFGDVESYQRMAATSVPLFLAFLPILIWFSIDGQIGDAISSSSGFRWLEFILGTVMGGTLGGAVLQKGIEAAKGSAGYVVAFNLSIPALTALMGWGLSFFDDTVGLAPDRWLISAILVVLASLVYFTYANRRRS